MALRIGFRTRGGATQGWGNIFRMAAFADYIARRTPCIVEFLVEGPGEVEDYLSQTRGFTVHGLGEEIPLREEAHLLRDLGRFDTIIMEMLEGTYERQQVLLKHTDRLVVFDDLLDQRYCAHVVVCGQDLPAYGNISISSQGTTFLTGYEYFMVNESFHGYLGQDKKQPEELRNILVAFGGGNYDEAYIKTAMALSDLGFAPRATFVLGYADTRALRRELRDIAPKATLFGGVENMHELLWLADAAVVSAGYLKLEAAITRTPMVAIATQWHQIPLGETFHKTTGALYAGYKGFITPTDIKAHLASLADRQTRQYQADRAALAIDGQGMKKLFRELFASPGGDAHV